MLGEKPDDKILQFPGVERDPTHDSPSCTPAITNHTSTPEITDSGKGLELFSTQMGDVDCQLLTDDRNELTRIDNRSFSFGAIRHVWSMLEEPVQNLEVLAEREAILNTLQSLPTKLRERLDQTAQSATYLLGAVWDIFDHWSDLGGAIREWEKLLEDETKRNRDVERVFADFVGTAGMLADVQQDMPQHIQVVRNLPHPFFARVAEELHRDYEIAKDFTLPDLKRIYETDDTKAFVDLKRKLESFCDTFHRWFAILMVADWEQQAVLLPTKTSQHREQATAVRDFRHLLHGDSHGFIEHVANNLPDQYPIEVISGGTGSGKSTWLKSRLMLQLTHQNFRRSTSDNVALKNRSQIVFANRGGSSHGEGLSAFGNDVTNKLMKFVPELQEEALIFLDEFGSTIPEDEAFYLLRALMDYFTEHDCKVYFATHNERFLKWIEEQKHPQMGLYHFKCDLENPEDPFSFLLQTGADKAHALSLLSQQGMPAQILLSAQQILLNSPLEARNIPERTYPEITPYSSEQRESLKTQARGLTGLSRRQDLIQGPDQYFGKVRSFKPAEWYSDDKDLPWGETPQWFPAQDLAFSASHPNDTGKAAPPASFNLRTYSDDDKIKTPTHFLGKRYNHRDLYDSTPEGLTSWGLSNDPAEILERQELMEALSQISPEEFNQAHENYRRFMWIAASFEPGSLNFNYQDLNRFNVAIWDFLANDLEKYKYFHKPHKIISWFLAFVEIAEITQSLNAEETKSLKAKLELTLKLLNRKKRAFDRKFDNYDDDRKQGAKKAKQIEKHLEKEIQNLWGEAELTKTLAAQAGDFAKRAISIDFLALDSQTQQAIGSSLVKHDVFEDTSLDNTTIGMLQVISALGVPANPLKPITDLLKSVDSMHTHQLANFMANNSKVPKRSQLVARIKERRDDPEKFSRRRGSLVSGTWYKECPEIMEIGGLISVAHEIKFSNWAKVTFNDTGEIDIRNISHPGVRMQRSEQTLNDFYLAPEQSFDVLEGATMGGKTNHLQSVHWAIRCAQSTGYVPAAYANLPVFDGMIYLDRVLEKEIQKLSAGQHEGKIWAEIINNICAEVRSQAKGKNYWFVIDEMFSSVPARYQRGLVVAILEELKSLGQRGQISIHNPSLVSKLLETDPKAYTVHHPEVQLNDAGQLEAFLHKIRPGRSVDKDGNFTAHSLETAEKMGLPKEIIERAKFYRSLDQSHC